MITDCSSCGRKLRVPDELLGKQVKCPTCGHTFQASAAESSLSSGELTSVVPPAAPSLELDSPSGQAERTLDSPQQAPAAHERFERSDEATQLVACPSCDKLIARGLSRCPQCGVVLEEEGEGDRPWEAEGFRSRLDAEPHRGVLIMVLGIISIVLVATVCGGPLGIPIGIIAWVMGQKDLRKMRENMMDPEGTGLTQAGWICGIIGTIMSSLCALGWLGYVGFTITLVSAFKNGPPTNVQIKKATQVVPAKPAAPGQPAKKAERGFKPTNLRDYLPPANC